MIENKSIVQIHLEPDEVLSKKKKPHIDRPRFRMVGMERMDAIRILTSMSANEGTVFNELIANIDYVTNKAYISQKGKTATQKNQWSKGYKSLADKKLVRRLKRGQPSLYMVNPDLILPKEYDDALALWKGNE